MGKHRAVRRSTNKIAAGAVVGGAAVVGVVMGAGPAQAQVDEGHYVGQRFAYGVIPTPEFNVNIVGNQFQQDYYGLGPQNLGTSVIAPTADGGNAGVGADPVSQWFGHYELHKTATGYEGTEWSWGLPLGKVVLEATPRRANTPR